MKNKIQLFIFLVLLMLLPIMVNASGTATIKCPKAAKIDEDVTCTITVTGNPGSIANSTISGNNYVEPRESSKQLTLSDDSAQTTVVVNAKSNGSGKITVSGTIDDVSITSLPEATIKVLNNVSTLSNITIDGESIPGFSPTSYSYTLEKDAGEIEIYAQRTSSNDSTVAGVGKKTLVCGSNK